MYQLSQLGSAKVHTASVWGHMYDNDKDRLEHALDSVNSETNNTILANAQASPKSIHRGLNNWIALATKGEPGVKSKSHESLKSYDIKATEHKSHATLDPDAFQTSKEHSGQGKPMKTLSSKSLHSQSHSQISETILRPVRYQSQLSRKASQLAGLNNSYSKALDTSVGQRRHPDPQLTKQLSGSPTHYTLDGETSQTELRKYHDIGPSIYTTAVSRLDIVLKSDTDSPTLPSTEGLEFRTRPHLRTVRPSPGHDEPRSPTLTELVAEVNENRVSMSIYSVSSTDNELFTRSLQGPQSPSTINGVATRPDQGPVMTNFLPVVPRKSPELKTFSSKEVAQSIAKMTTSPLPTAAANHPSPSRPAPLWSPSLIQSNPTSRHSSIHTVARSKYSSPTWQNRGIFRHESASSSSLIRHHPEGKVSRRASIRKSTQIELSENKNTARGSVLSGRKGTVLGKRQSQGQRSPSEDFSGQCAAAKPKHARFDLSQFKILSSETTMQLEQNLGRCQAREAEARSLYASLSAKRKEIQCNLDSLPTLSIPSIVAVTEIARLAKCVTDIDDAVLNASKDIEQSLREHADVERRLLEHTVALAMKGTQPTPQGLLRQDLLTPPPSPECHELDAQTTIHREEVTSAAYTEAAVASLMASIESELHALRNRHV